MARHLVVDKTQTIDSRDELIYLLCEAASVEHSLMCQYLFCGFSLKVNVSEGVTDEQMNQICNWERFILMVARQEMEHLGLVCNLLSAIGAAPYFSHPTFPYPTSLYRHSMSLDRFSAQTLKKFICFERPRGVDPRHAFCFEPDLQIKGLIDVVAPSPLPYETVGELYEALRRGFENVAKRNSNLFIGPLSTQVTGDELLTNFVRKGATGGGYDIFMAPVTNLESALKVIDLIIHQGEATKVDPKCEEFELSHFRVFQRIYCDLLKIRDAHPQFEPARAVVSNPVLYPDAGRPGQTKITDPNSRAVLDLLDGAYGLMLLLLLRFFSHVDENKALFEEVRAAAFFPFMTMVIRPLTEVLTSLPAYEHGGPERAGPSFEVYPNVSLVPHTRSAWRVLYERFEELADDAKQISQRTQMPERVAYIAESLELIRRRLASVLHPLGIPL
jgi:hypothetical protein